MSFIRILFFLMLVLTTPALFSQSSLWTDVEHASLNSRSVERGIVPSRYRALKLDRTALEDILRRVGLRGSGEDNFAVIDLPMPGGGYQSFRIEEAPLMPPALAGIYPEIRTFAGQGLDRAGSAVYLDVTHAGFHAMILWPDTAIFIDPAFRNDDSHYISYYKRDLGNSKLREFTCGVQSGTGMERPSDQMRPVNSRSSAVDLRTYKIAITATGEYTAYHGGTEALALSAINTTLNRVRGIFETELAVSFTLVANNNLIIYTDAGTDPFTNPQADLTTLNENQSNTDLVIGNSNYDIGHLMTTGNGGLAGLGVTCLSGNKAKGMTGFTSPLGDPFDVDLVCHEIGHQFNANHTFNGDAGSCSGGNRNAATAYEPDSGSTIMAYAGICSGQNLQSNSHAYFHQVSLNEMYTFATSGSGNSCPVVSSSGNNTPAVNADAENIDGKYIPVSTPFELTASGSDPDGDNITYGWEQFDLGAAGAASSSSPGPVFRSFPPVSSPVRAFPALSNILENMNGVGEFLPSITRDLNFKCTVRDNNPAGGGTAVDSIVLHVSDQAGPFQITSHNATSNLEGVIAVTWDVAGTDQSPVNCSQVDILLSTDGGVTFAALETNVSNDGSESVTLPANASGQARLKIKCSDNVFFDINNADLRIVPAAATCAEQVTNYDLENGSTGWTEYSSNGFGLIGGWANVHSGTGSAWLGGAANETSRLSQTITIPSGQHFSNLEFWYRLTTFDCGGDVFNVKVNGSVVQTISLCNNTAAAGWTRVLIDLSAYQGTSPTIMLEVICDQTNHSNIFLDDISVYTCEGGQFAVLPVELSAFTAVARMQTAFLTWTTQSETGNEGFGIEMKTDGEDFREIAFVDGAGTTADVRTYDHAVHDLLPGTYYFRLRQQDFNGSRSFSPVRSVGIVGSSKLTVGPNPASDRIYFELKQGQEGDYRLEVLDINGRQVGLLTGSQTGGDIWRESMDLSGFASGIYLYRLSGLSGQESGRFIVK